MALVKTDPLHEYWGKYCRLGAVGITTKATALQNTTQLLRQYRDGDQRARDQLIERYMPLISSWAHGRLPTYGRDLSDTDDLVQITFIRALGRLSEFESERPGAFLYYLRTILMNAVRDELRRRKVRPNTQSMLETMPSNQISLVEQILGNETLEAYEQALSKLPHDKRIAVIMRLEFEMSYQEIADELGERSANSTRMMIARAVNDVGEAMAR